MPDKGVEDRVGRLAAQRTQAAEDVAAFAETIDDEDPLEAMLAAHPPEPADE